MNRDQNYWNKYYGQDLAPHEPSPFAKYVMLNFLSKEDKVIEFGCGNGRDAVFFARNGVDVLAIDQSKTGIDELRKRINGYPIRFAATDFCSLDDINNGFSAVYSRFTLHAVSKKQQSSALLWASRNLQDGGLLAIEVRGHKNELYGLGEPVEGEPDAFIYDNHYRRFIKLDQLTHQLTELGFSIIEASEKTGFAPFGETDYHFIRVIARKS